MFESRTSHMPRVRAGSRVCSRQARQTTRARTPETECRTWCRHGHLIPSGSERSRCRAQWSPAPATSSCRRRSIPTRACTWGCRRSSKSTAQRTNKYPRCVARNAWEPGPRCRAGWTGCSLLPCAPTGGALEKSSVPGPSAEFASLDDQLAARQHHVYIALHLKSLEHRVIHTHVMRGGADGVVCLWVPDHEVGVTAYRDFPLAWIHAK